MQRGECLIYNGILETFNCLSNEDSSMLKLLKTAWIPVKRCERCSVQFELNPADLLLVSLTLPNIYH